MLEAVAKPVRSHPAEKGDAGPQRRGSERAVRATASYRLRDRGDGGLSIREEMAAGGNRADLDVSINITNDADIGRAKEPFIEHIGFPRGLGK